MAGVISLEAHRIEKALKKGQKNNGPLDPVTLYKELLLHKQLYQKMLVESKEQG